MNSIPLIKGNTPQEINTSIIALKKALSELEAQDRLLQGTDKDVQNKIKQINELIEGINTHLGTVDNHLTTIDNQITALQPVDTVASGNMHSVSSNAVYNALSNYAKKIDALSFLSVSPRILNTPASLTAEIKSLYDQGYRLIILSVGWQEYESYPHAGAMGIIILSETSAIGTGFLREYSSYKFNYACHWTDYIRTDRFTGWVQIS